MNDPEITVAELGALHATGVTIIDVREPDEYRDGHVTGAPLLPLATVAEHADELPRDRPVYVICKSGGRSLQAVQRLRSAGIDAVNVAGGTMAWIEAGQPVARGDAPG